MYMHSNLCVYKHIHTFKNEQTHKAIHIPVSEYKHIETKINQYIYNYAYMHNSNMHADIYRYSYLSPALL